MDSGRPLDDVTGEIVDAAFKLHTALGPGLLESVYEAVLCRDLPRRGLQVERQKLVSFEYDGLRFDDGLRVDLLVDARVVVEIKSIEKAAAVHGKQVLTYLRLMKLPVGLPHSASPRLRVNQSDGAAPPISPEKAKI